MFVPMKTILQTVRFTHNKCREREDLIADVADSLYGGRKSDISFEKSLHMYNTL